MTVYGRADTDGTTLPQWSRPRIGRMTLQVDEVIQVKYPPQWSRPRIGRMTRAQLAALTGRLARRNGAGRGSAG